LPWRKRIKRLAENSMVTEGMSEKSRTVAGWALGDCAVAARGGTKGCDEDGDGD
jgi:hypothetical protein